MILHTIGQAILGGVVLFRKVLMVMDADIHDLTWRRANDPRENRILRFETAAYSRNTVPLPQSLNQSFDDRWGNCARRGQFTDQMTAKPTQMPQTAHHSAQSDAMESTVCLTSS
jgi:hypothetical protein